MKTKKMYLITAYMMLMLATLILVFNNQALAVEPKVENNDKKVEKINHFFELLMP